LITSAPMTKLARFRTIQEKGLRGVADANGTDFGGLAVWASQVGNAKGITKAQAFDLLFQMLPLNRRPLEQYCLTSSKEST
jgi:hypothetical protein